MLRDAGVGAPCGGHAPKAGGRQRRKAAVVMRKLLGWGWWWASLGQQQSKGTSFSVSPVPGKETARAPAAQWGAEAEGQGQKSPQRSPATSHYPEDAWKLREGRKSPSSPARNGRAVLLSLDGVLSYCT